MGPPAELVGKLGQEKPMSLQSALAPKSLLGYQSCGQIIGYGFVVCGVLGGLGCIDDLSVPVSRHQSHLWLLVVMFWKIAELGRMSEIGEIAVGWRSVYCQHLSGFWEDFQKWPVVIYFSAEWVQRNMWFWFCCCHCSRLVVLLIPPCHHVKFLGYSWFEFIL